MELTFETINGSPVVVVTMTHPENQFLSVLWFALKGKVLEPGSLSSTPRTLDDKGHTKEYGDTRLLFHVKPDWLDDAA